MIRILRDVSLKNMNTFGIDAHGAFFAEIGSVAEFRELVNETSYQTSDILVLGGGSNILFTKNFNGLVIRNCIPGISVVSENEDEAMVRAGAGVNWHELVEWCIDRNYGGVENLSLIPGNAGAGPMQNIGAYGVEIKDVFAELEACSMTDGTLRIFTKDDCMFGYRDSVFKHRYKNAYLITSVTLRLKKNPVLNTSYGAINEELKRMNVTSAGIKEVSQAVIRIRQSKLPDPVLKGNAGSFFKNPEVPAVQHDALRKKFQGLVSYPLENGSFKLAAGWLIEQCGLKGYRIGNAAVHDKQALVLVNCDRGGRIESGMDIYNLSCYIMQQVEQKFGVTLEREVNLI